MNQPLLERFQLRGQASDGPVIVVPTVEEATLMVRLFLEHVGEMHGHDVGAWIYDEHGVARGTCQLCDREAKIFYRANREPRYTHDLAEPCPARQAQPMAWAG